MQFKNVLNIERSMLLKSNSKAILRDNLIVLATPSIGRAIYLTSGTTSSPGLMEYLVVIVGDCHWVALEYLCGYILNLTLF